MNQAIVFAVLAVFASCILAKPQQQTTPVPIISQSSQNDGNGNFQYKFETGDGIKDDVQGQLKQIQVNKYSDDGKVIGQDQVQAQVQSGKFSYPSPDGTVIELTWTADENGFQPQVSLAFLLTFLIKLFVSLDLVPSKMLLTIFNSSFSLP